MDFDAMPMRRLDQENTPEEAEKQHEIGAVNTMLLVFLLGLCIFLAYMIKKHRFYYVPESAGAMLVGCVVGGLIKAFNPGDEELDFLSFDPEIFYFLLLPPIIFEAGFTLRKKRFFSNLATILMFAVGGTVVSTFVVGFLTFACGKSGIIEIATEDPLEALLFGALISAVDPVATLSIMGSAELNCDPLLYSLVFGESVLNDAVAIVLFRIFSKFQASGQAFNEASLALVMSEFLGVSIGSVFCGVLIGLICSYVCKHTLISAHPHYEIAILFLFAYGSYALAELVALSGIMSLFFSGITLSHYNSYNLSTTSRITSEVTFKALATVSEFFVYLYMGMGIFTGRYRSWNFTFVFLAIIFCLLGRLFNIFPFSFAANLFRRQRIPLRMQIVIWFAGLRGAIAFALSQNMPADHRDLYTTTTLSIVLFTTVVCGGLTEPLLGKMGMKLQQGQAPSDDPDGQTPYESLVSGRENALVRRVSLADKVYTGFHGMWRQLDDLYMKPLFGGSTKRRSFRNVQEAEMHDLVSSDDDATTVGDDADDFERKVRS
uniref:Sodium/hydrogen exchanger n=1 Tax=Phaeomonas parva TaxID=124430 RepID=A0A7S1TVF8_9STRA|mmetsp:Transcript_1959/g.5831  ORF Transcript_1959/g.5831 Transcript_1959/m.5831 type:complete len:546 (+) Transcript_1959:187-1824(+)